MWSSSSFAGLAGGFGEEVEEEDVVVVDVDVWRRSHGCGRVRRHDRQSHWQDWRGADRKAEVVGLCIEMVEGLIGREVEAAILAQTGGHVIRKALALRG